MIYFWKIVMDNGKVIESGSFNELINKRGEFYNLYSIEGEKDTIL